MNLDVFFIKSDFQMKAKNMKVNNFAWAPNFESRLRFSVYIMHYESVILIRCIFSVILNE